MDTGIRNTALEKLRNFMCLQMALHGAFQSTGYGLVSWCVSVTPTISYHQSIAHVRCQTNAVTKCRVAFLPSRLLSLLGMHELW